MSKIFGQALLDDMVRTEALPMPLVKQAAKEILVVIREGLLRDGVVKVSNFGTFRLKPVAARQGINPQTGETITIPAQQRVIFSPSKALRDLIQPVHQPPQPIEPDTVSATPRPQDKTPEIQEKSTTSHPAGDNTASTAPSLLVASHEVTAKLVPASIPAPESEPQEAASESVPLEIESEDSLAVRKETEDSQQEEQEKARSGSRSHEPDEHPLRGESLPEIPMPMVNPHDSEPPVDAHTEAPSRSNSSYYLSAAMLVLVALISAGMLYESSTETSDRPHEAANTVPPPTTLAAAPVTTESQLTDIATSVAVVRPASGSDDTQGQQNHASLMVAAKDQATAVAAVTPESHTESLSETEFGSPVHVGAADYFFTEQAHEIIDGESLWRLARHHYRDPLLWPHIYQANTAFIDNPDHLLVGSTITIPGLQGPPDRLTPHDRHQIAEGYYLAYLHYKRIGREDALFALLEAKRYDNSVVEKYRSRMQLSQAEELQLAVQQTMPF